MVMVLFLLKTMIKGIIIKLNEQQKERFCVSLGVKINSDEPLEDYANQIFPIDEDAQEITNNHIGEEVEVAIHDIWPKHLNLISLTAFATINPFTQFHWKQNK